MVSRKSNKIVKFTKYYDKIPIEFEDKSPTAHERHNLSHLAHAHWWRLSSSNKWRFSNKREHTLRRRQGLWPWYPIYLATCWDPICISSKSGKLWLWVPTMQGVEVQLHNWMEILQFHSKVLRHQRVETACHYFSKKTSISESGYFSTACSGKKAHLKPAVEMQNPLPYTLAVEKKPVTTSPGNTGQIFAYILMNFCIS